MKNKKVLTIGILLLIIIIYVSSIFMFGNKTKTIINKPFTKILSKKPRLEDDFYNYTNYNQLNKDKLGDEQSWMYIDDSAEKIITDSKKEAIDTILNNCTLNEINKSVCELYNSYNNNDQNQMKAELDKYIDIINSSKNINEYIDNVLLINDVLSTNILFTTSINFKPSNYKQPYFTFNSFIYDFNRTENEIYSLDSNKQKVNNLKKFSTKMLEEYGYSENQANKMVSKVQQMYKEISRFSLHSDKLEEKGYTDYSLTELQSNLQNINLNKIINYNSTIYNPNGNILVVDIKQLKAIDKYLVEENLDTLKSYAIMNVLTDYSEYLNKSLYELHQKYNEKINGKPVKEYDKKEIIYDIIYDTFKDTITNEVAKKHLSAKEKAVYTNLIIEEINTYKTIIDNEVWLSDKTKMYAKEKMDKMKYEVGIPNEFAYAEKNYNLQAGSSYLTNLANIRKNLKNEANRQYMNGNIYYGTTDYLVVNAFYAPDMNSIHIILGWIIAMDSTFDINDNNIDSKYYEILGSTGSTIGHELSHAIDPEGSKYDAYGNLYNWWTEEDKEKFDNLNRKVVKYYNQYKQFGDTTLGENVADLGAMKVIMQIAENKNATTENYKKVFETYAQTYCSQTTPYYDKLLLFNDVHSPNKNRTNAVLSSTDKFYEIYNIKENDKMYIQKKDRVSVW